jgi:hypothetical protein
MRIKVPATRFLQCQCLVAHGQEKIRTCAEGQRRSSDCRQIALVSGAKQASNSPNYGQGAKAYGEHFGAVAADGFTDINRHNDRWGYSPNTLTSRSALLLSGNGHNQFPRRHAISSPFVAKGDNRKWQPNYSSLGGDLASSAIANLYYPQSNRGPGLLLGNFAIGTAERVGTSLAQEFLFGKFTRRGSHVN